LTLFVAVSDEDYIKMPKM